MCHLGWNTGQAFVMLEFSQELDSLRPPGHPAVRLQTDEAQSCIPATLSTWQRLQYKDAATFPQQLAKGLHDLPWHVQEAFGRNERQNQGLNNLQVLRLPTKPGLHRVQRGSLLPFVLTQHLTVVLSWHLSLTAFQAGESILFSAKSNTAVKELTDSC